MTKVMTYADTKQSSLYNGRYHPLCGQKKLAAVVSSKCLSFFIIQGIMHKKFVLYGHIVNRKFHYNILKHLRKKVRCKWPDLWKKLN